MKIGGRDHTLVIFSLIQMKFGGMAQFALQPSKENDINEGN